jgi:hypothetical protein
METGMEQFCHQLGHEALEGLPVIYGWKGDGRLGWNSCAQRHLVNYLSMNRDTGMEYFMAPVL